MRRIGISIYPDHSDFVADKNYLNKAAKLGYKRIFMSMLEINESKEVTSNKYKKIINIANELGFETILDISPRIFDQLEISYSDLSFFHELGVQGIRLDNGFDGLNESLLSYNEFGLIIELNMSNNVDYLNNIISYKPNTPYLYGCHNFYPQKGTALPYDFFVECSKRFRKFNINSAAFVTSQVGKIGPWQVNDGLPTLEEDRYLPISVQAKRLFATNLIDDIIISNAYASDQELRDLSELNRYQVTFDINPLKNDSNIEKEIMFDFQHFRRGDMNNLVIRSTMPRVKYKEVPNPPHDNEIEFQPGDIVIGNDNFGIYKNELQIVLLPHTDNRKNKVGQINSNELSLLNFIEPWSKFKITQNIN